MIAPRSLLPRIASAIPAPLMVALVLATLGACKHDEPDAGSASAGTASPRLAEQSTAELSTPIATIDDTVITVGAFQDRINRQSPYIRARYTSLEQKREFLDNLIRFEVLAGEAFARGLDKDPDVVRTMKQVMIQKLMKGEFEHRIKPEDISDTDMRAFYEAHHDDYNKPEEVRVSAIVLTDQETAAKVATIARSDRGKTNRGFRELVTKHSTDQASKIRGGDLRYFSRDTKDIPKAVVDAAFAMAKTGDIAGPIAAGAGRYYVIKQTGRRKALAKQYEEVKRQIQNRLYRDRRTKAQKDFIAALKAKATITIDDKALAKVRVDTSAPTPGPGQPLSGTGLQPARAAGHPPRLAPRNGP